MQSMAKVYSSLPAHSSQICDDGEWFDILRADTPQLRDRVYRLRYQVYCRERGFEATDAFPDMRETDGFDGQSVHSLIINRVDCMAIGTVRLILAGDVESDSPFPIQQICPSLRVFPRATTAEISRFAITKATRKLPIGNALPGSTNFRYSGSSGKVSRPSIVLGLMRAIIRMSSEHGISDWLAVMEPALLRHLARYGIYFQPEGPLVDYHGLRQPCSANISHLLTRMQGERPDILTYITG